MCGATMPCASRALLQYATGTVAFLPLGAVRPTRGDRPNPTPVRARPRALGVRGRRPGRPGTRQIERKRIPEIAFEAAEPNDTHANVIPVSHSTGARARPAGAVRGRGGGGALQARRPRPAAGRPRRVPQPVPGLRVARGVPRLVRGGPGGGAVL